MKKSTPERAKSARVSSFGARVAPGCRVLVLGTVPSERSLALQQSYAHAQNLFWPFMGELFSAGPELEYEQRIAQLQRAGIGLWDVLKHCERPGSLDSSIVRASEVPNALPQLLAAHPSIHACAFNGAKAYEVFKRHTLPLLLGQPFAQLKFLPLPSTSPANASISRAEKLRQWSVLKELLRNESGA
jgi:double-stranded uracil-DNA glycosylase